MNAEIFEFMQKLLRGSHDDNLKQKYQPFGYPFVRANMFSSTKKSRRKKPCRKSRGKSRRKSHGKSRRKSHGKSRRKSRRKSRKSRKSKRNKSAQFDKELGIWFNKSKVNI